MRAASGSYLISKMTKKRDDPSRRIILPPEVLCLMVHMGRGIQIQIQWNSFIIKHRPTPTFYSGDLGHEETRRGEGGEGRKIIWQRTFFYPPSYSLSSRNQTSDLRRDTKSNWLSNWSKEFWSPPLPGPGYCTAGATSSDQLFINETQGNLRLASLVGWLCWALEFMK